MGGNGGVWGEWAWYAMHRREAEMRTNVGHDCLVCRLPLCLSTLGGAGTLRGIWSRGGGRPWSRAVQVMYRACFKV